MEKVVFILFFMFLPVIGFAQDKPMDIPSLELLINAHKKKYKKLDERNSMEVVHTTLTQKVSNLTSKYQDIHSQLSGRYSMLSTWATSGLSVVSLIKEVKNTFPLLQSLLQQTKHLKNVYVIREYTKVIDKVGLECKYLAATIKKIPLLKSDAAAMAELIAELQSHVSSIDQLLRTSLFMIQGYVGLQNMGYKDMVIDKAKIANEVIKDFSK